MDTQVFMQSLGVMALCSVVVKYACDSFEDASTFLGTRVYRMPPGVRGATIEAVGSSLPELCTTAFLLFLFHDRDGFSAGIATCAGSAIFNAVLIPAVCILAVCLRGVRRAGVTEKVSHIHLDKKVLLRDGLYFVLAELALIAFLGKGVLFWWMGGLLLAVYLLYFARLMRDMGGDGGEEDAPEPEDAPPKSLWRAAATFDFQGLLYRGAPLTASRAWVVLSLATATIAAASYFLSVAVLDSADALGVPAYFTAVILAAAATSVPDTVLSVKNALKGDYDDAVSNAVGSNIFDICVALGLPLLAYGLIYGPVALSSGVGHAASVRELRLVLLLVTAVVLGLFLFGSRGKVATRLGLGKGLCLLGVYCAWTAFVAVRALA